MTSLNKPHNLANNNLHSRDLLLLATKAKQRNMPILLIIFQQECPFCELLREEIIKPMLISGEYENTVLITEILMDDYDSIIGFDGYSTTPVIYLKIIKFG